MLKKNALACSEDRIFVLTNVKMFREIVKGSIFKAFFPRCGIFSAFSVLVRIVFDYFHDLALISLFVGRIHQTCPLNNKIIKLH